MRAQTRRYLAKVVCLLAILGLVGMAACSQATPPNPTSPGRPPSTSSATVQMTAMTLPRASDTPPGATQVVGVDQMTITYAAYMDPMYPEKRTILQPLADEFHRKNPTITVRLINLFDVPSKDMENNMAKVADVFGMEGNFSYGSGFLNLQPLMDASPDFNLHDFLPGVAPRLFQPGWHALWCTVDLFGHGDLLRPERSLTS